MVELRSKVSSLESTQLKLEQIGAKLTSEYTFKDIIYTKNENINPHIRLRVYTHNEWDTKNIILQQKQTDYRKEFNTLEEADKVISTEFNDFKEAFSYSRKGFEYTLPNTRIFLEEIEHLGSSIEVISDSEKTIKELFNKVNSEYIFENNIVETVYRNI